MGGGGAAFSRLGVLRRQRIEGAGHKRAGIGDATIPVASPSPAVRQTAAPFWGRGRWTTLLNNPALRLFGVTYLILVLKMVAVGYATSFYRIRDKHFATPEDYRLQGLTPKTGVNEDVERARRAHQNDLENILPYFGVGLLYALTNPSLGMARLCFIGFTVARILHSSSTCCRCSRGGRSCGASATAAAPHDAAAPPGSGVEAARRNVVTSVVNAACGARRSALR